MKRFVALLLSGVLMLGTVSTNTAASANHTIELLFSENFDYTNDGDIADAGDTYEKSSKIRVKTVQGYAGKSLEYLSQASGDMYYEIIESGAANNLIIEFDIMISKLDSNTIDITFKDKYYKEYRICRMNTRKQLLWADGTVLTTFTTGAFHHVCFNINLETYKTDVYVNQSLKGNQLSFNESGIQGAYLFRLSMASSANNSNDKIYLDNIKLYDDTQPIFAYEKAGTQVDVVSKFTGSEKSIATDSETHKCMDGTVAMYVGANRIAKNGQAEYFYNDNKNIRVYNKDGQVFVPAEVVIAALGGTSQYNSGNGFLSASYNSKSLVLYAGQKTCVSNGATVTMMVAPEIKEEIMFVPVSCIADFFGKKVTYDKSGMVVIADRENFFDCREDLGVFRNLAGNLVFDPPKGEDAITALKTKYPNKQHPRLYFNKAEFEELKNEINSNSLMANWYASVKASADKALTLPVQEYVIPDGIRLYDACNVIKERTRDLAFVYLMTGDSKYAARAMTEIENAASYKDWNPYHFLDTSEMIIAFSVVYDWLYDYMTQAQRDMMKTALIEKGLKPAVQDYTNDPSRSRSFQWTMIGREEPSNWTIICNASVVLASLAFGDEIDMSAQLLDYAFDNIKFPILMYGPDGAWYEGPSYWGFTTVNYVDFADSIINVLGDDFGYLDVPGIAEAAHYYYTAQKFNIHDSGTVTGPQAPYNPQFFFFADKFNDSGLAKANIDAMANSKAAGTIRDLLFYNYKKGASDEITLKKDYYYRDSEIAIMTNGWNSANSIYAGLHGGKVITKHSHMDAGQFVIDGYGTRFAMDLGKDDYNLGGSQWDRYRYRAEGHNTLVINPDASGGQFTLGEAVIERFESNEQSAITTVDLTGAYSNQAHSIKRGMKLTNNRSMIILQDEMKLFEPSEVYWFMHTQCPITILENGKVAKFTGENKDMYVYLLNDVEGVFSVMDATPLPTSPVVSGQNVNSGYRKLCFKADNVTDMTLSVAFSFEDHTSGNAVLCRPEVVAIDNWTLDEAQPPADEIIPFDNFESYSSPFSETTAWKVWGTGQVQGAKLVDKGKGKSVEWTSTANQYHDILKTGLTGNLSDSKTAVIGFSARFDDFNAERSLVLEGLNDNNSKIRAAVINITKNGKVCTENEESNITLGEDKWYDISVEIKLSDMSARLSVTDKNKEQVAEGTISKFVSSPPASWNRIDFMAAATGEDTKISEAYIDNAYFYCVPYDVSRPRSTVQNFDSFKGIAHPADRDGTLKDGWYLWQGTSGVNTIRSKSFDDAKYGTAIEFVADGATDTKFLSSIVSAFQGTDTKLNIDYDFLQTKGGMTTKLKGSKAGGSTVDYYPLIDVLDTGAVYGYSKQFCVIEKNQWYHMSMHLDFSANRFVATVTKDGELVGTTATLEAQGIAFPLGEIATAGWFGFFVNPQKSAGGFEFCVDNVAVSTLGTSADYFSHGCIPAGTHSLCIDFGEPISGAGLSGATFFVNGVANAASYELWDHQTVKLTLKQAPEYNSECIIEAKNVRAANGKLFNVFFPFYAAAEGIRLSKADYMIDGTKVDKIKDGALKVAPDITNDGTEKTVEVVAAIYKDECLVRIETVSYAFSQGDTYRQVEAIDMGTIDSDCKVKLFLWDSLKSCMPMCPADELN